MDPRTDNEYYEKVYQALEEKGYKIIGERFLGYSRPYSPLDAVIINGKEFILVEIKSEKEAKDLWTMAEFDYTELSKTNPDRPYLYYFQDVNEMVKAGKVAKNIAAHMYFLEKTVCKAIDFYAGRWWIKNEEYDLADKKLRAGYSVPSFVSDDAEKAMQRRSAKYDTIKLPADVLFLFNFLSK